MNIIKQGKTKEELKAILNVTKRFECKTCGCVFEADKGEYETEEARIYSYYYCKCPNCGQKVNEVIFWERMRDCQYYE